MLTPPKACSGPNMPEGEEFVLRLHSVSSLWSRSDGTLPCHVSGHVTQPVFSFLAGTSDSAFRFTHTETTPKAVSKRESV